MDEDQNATEEVRIAVAANEIGESSVEVFRSADAMSTGSSSIHDLDPHAGDLTVADYVDEREFKSDQKEGGRPKLVDDGRYQLEVIIGPDNRVRVQNTAQWPWSVHGHMRMRFPNGKVYIGTGSMINKHHVLTAGHCVFSKADGGWATSVSFEPGRNDNALPFGTHFATRLLSVTGWTQNGNSDWDYGMLVLSTDIGSRTGWKGIITGPDSMINRHRVNVSGYPGDKGGHQLWTHADAVTSAAQERFFYQIDTVGGQSGSGVWSTWQGHSGEKICGVHTTGSTSGNGATRISRPKFDRIVGWMSQY